MGLPWKSGYTLLLIGQKNHGSRGMETLHFFLSLNPPLPLSDFEEKKKNGTRIGTRGKRQYNDSPARASRRLL